MEKNNIKDCDNSNFEFLFIGADPYIRDAWYILRQINKDLNERYDYIQNYGTNLYESQYDFCCDLVEFNSEEKNIEQNITSENNDNLIHPYYSRIIDKTPIDELYYS
jgi:hypothetical protein